MKTVELALKAARARQSPLTQFVHLSHELPERGQETIPVYENFCFVLTLFRTKTAEHVLEGRALLDRLFAFQTPDGFPVHLHEFPSCKSRTLQYKLSTVARFLIRDFGHVLGEALLPKVKALIRPIETGGELADRLIQSQLLEDASLQSFDWWDGEALCYTGPMQKQDRYEPAVTLLDLIMGEWSSKMSARALLDHPAHLQGCLIYPKAVTLGRAEPRWSCRFWGDGHPTHSAALHTQGAVSEEGATIFVDLPEKEVHDTVEISYFINRDPSAQFFVASQRSTTFLPGEPVAIHSGGLSFEMTFTVPEGDGRFWGHLHLGNRPGQIGCKGESKHDAFDRVIAFRTVERTKPARIKIDFRLLLG